MFDTRQDLSPRSHSRPGLRVPVVLIAGDGIGPEVAEAASRLLSEVYPPFHWLRADAGERVMEKGIESGLPRETLSKIDQVGLVLKGPLASSGGASSDVTLRNVFDLYGNVRPIQALPGLGGPFADRDINFTIIRENTKDLNPGSEHMQTPDVAQGLKLVTRKGCKKIGRLAFAMAEREHRSSVHVVADTHTLRLTDGLFKATMQEISRDHPKIDVEHVSAHDCAHQMVMRPEQFEVVITPPTDGSILGDLGAGLIGGRGLAPSARIGDSVAIFETVHSASPDRAGRGLANPTALIRSGIMLLRHMGENAAAARLNDALSHVYRNGTYLTPDVARSGTGVSTSAFCDAVLTALAEVPERPVPAGTPFMMVHQPTTRRSPLPLRRSYDGADVFVEWAGDVRSLAAAIKTTLTETGYELTLISNQGDVAWPVAQGRANASDHWQCRLMLKPEAADEETHLARMLEKLSKVTRWMHVEKLETVDGAPGYCRTPSRF